MLLDFDNKAEPMMKEWGKAQTGVLYPDIEQMMAYKQKMDQLPILKRRTDHLRRRLQETGRQESQVSARLQQLLLLS